MNPDPWRAAGVLALLISILPATAGAAEPTPAAPPPSPLPDCEEELAAGDLALARACFAAAYLADTQRPEAAARLADLDLWSNRLADAEQWAWQAARAASADPRPAATLATIAYRRNDFPLASRLARRRGNGAEAAKLESFGGTRPYEMPPGFVETRLSFRATDPLPIVDVRLNGSEPIAFVIDTGAFELIVDPAVAKRVGIRSFGEEVSTFAGGKTSPIGHGHLDSISLGEVEVRHVPVQLLDTRRFTQALGGIEVGGVVGTSFLAQFLATIDYRGGALVLRRKGAIFAPSAGAREVPIWWVGSHFLLASGAVNASPPQLFFVDTGLAGAAFTAPASTLASAGIDLGAGAISGMGGGGKVSVTPFTAARLSLGAVTAQDLPGFAGAFPPSLEHRFPCRIGGLISHQFFRPYALTFDFEKMRLLIE